MSLVVVESGVLKRLSIALLVLVGLISFSKVEAQTAGEVWTNPRSMVYHCPGTEYYGRTTRGQYVGESEARRQGYRPVGGKPCAVPAADTGDDAPSAPPDSVLRTCQVEKITDGDTIRCEGIGPVRLIGIDSPEDDQPPFGVAATAGLASMLPNGADIRLEFDRTERDRYGRLLAYLWRDGTMLNWAMVRQGWAVAFRYPPDVRYASRFEAAEARARAEGRGLWRVGGFRCLPVDHRNKRCDS